MFWCVFHRARLYIGIATDNVGFALALPRIPWYPEAETLCMPRCTLLVGMADWPADLITDLETEGPAERVTDAPAERVTEAPPAERMTDAPADLVTEAPPADRVTERLTEFETD